MLYYQYMHGDKYSRQEISADAAPSKKIKPGRGRCGGGVLCTGAEGKEIDPCIDIVIGNNHKKDLPELLKQYEMEKAVIQNMRWKISTVRKSMKNCI